MANLEAKFRQCLRCKTNYTVMEYTASPIGLPNVLYVDSSGPTLYTYDTVNNTYVSFNEVQDAIEAIIDLTTSLSPLDTNNPTTAEVQAWATANLTGTDLTNGTQLIYNAPSGGDAANPDYTWTVNNGIVTLSDKRVFENSTIYVDANSGSDVTGKRGYKNFPYKTFNSAVTNYQSGDTIVLGKGSYTRSISMPIVSEFNLISNGTLTLSSFYSNSTDTTNKKINIKANDISASSAIFYLKNTEIDVDVSNFTTSSNLGIPDGTSAIYKIKNFTKTSSPGLFYTNSFQNKLNFKVDNYIVNASGYGGLISYEQGTNIDLDNKSNGSICIDINNYIHTGAQGHLFHTYDITSKTVSDYKFLFDINLIKQSGWVNNSQTNIGLIMTDQVNTNYSNNVAIFNLENVNIDYSLFYKKRAVVGIDYFINIDKLKVNQSSIMMFGTAANNIINSNILFNIKKGDVTYIFDQHSSGTNQTIITNSTIMINGDITTNTNVVPRLTLDATSKLVFKGRFNLGDKKFDLSNIDGAGADNVYFEDCTIVTTGTNSIDAGTAKNIKVLNTRSNKPVNTNITELISTITVNNSIN